MPLGQKLRQYVIGVGEMIQWRKATDGHGGPIDTRELVGREPEAPQPEAKPTPASEKPPAGPIQPPVTPGTVRIVIKPKGKLGK